VRAISDRHLEIKKMRKILQAALANFSVYMKISVLLFMLVPLTGLTQNSVDAYPYHDNADRIVAFFIGDEVFRQFVKLDTKKSKNITHNAFFFQYNFRHPKFSGETFVIAFTLDSAGQFVPGEETRGLVRILSPNDSAWVTGRQALSICRGRGHRTKKRSLRLGWDQTDVSYQLFQKTNDFRDIVPGDMVWKVDGEVLFRGDRYSGTFEVNVLNGTLARRFAIPWD
jgi:hypothetical protein